MPNKETRARQRNNRLKGLNANTNGSQVDNSTAKTREKIIQQEARRNNGKPFAGPAKPAKAAKPLKSVQSPQSANRFVPLKPTETAKPVVPAKTVKPAETVKFVKPAKPTETFQLVQRTKPAETVEPVEPVKPSAPAETVKTINYIKPATPAETVKTIKPATPWETTKPATPWDIIKPSKPVDPAKESNVKVPNQQTKSGKPNTLKVDKALVNARNRIVEQEARRNNGLKPLKPVNKSALKLTDLPKEILQKILIHVMVHRYPIPVDPVFARANKRLKPAFDYRILHLHPKLYQAGMRLYYSLNTFNISMQRFNEGRRSLKPDDWPTTYGRILASKYVSTVHVNKRRCGTWGYAVKLLKGFQNLDKLVFDSRANLVVDNHKEGGMLMGFIWTEKPASDELVDLLKQNGISVADGGVWIGETNEWGAESDEKNVIKQIREFMEIGKV